MNTEAIIPLTYEQYINVCSFIKEKFATSKKFHKYDMNMISSSGSQITFVNKGGRIFKTLYSKYKIIRTVCSFNIRYVTTTKKIQRTSFIKHLANYPDAKSVQISHSLMFNILDGMWLFELRETSKDKTNIPTFFSSPEIIFKSTKDNLFYSCKLKKNDNKKIIKYEAIYIASLIEAAKLGYSSITAFDALVNLSEELNLYPYFKSYFIQPVTFVGKSLPEGEYIIKHKADGHRVLIIMNKDLIVIGDNYKTYWLVRDLPSSKKYVATGEIIGNTIMLFDCLQADGKNVMDENYFNKLHYLSEFIEVTKKNQVPIEFKVDKVYKHFPDILKSQPDYPTDGYILIETNKKFEETHIYKLKPIEYQTIDFTVKIKDDIVELYVWKNVRDNTGCKKYIPLMFATTPMSEIEMNLVDGKVYECKWNGKYWVPVRYRHDKQYGNNIKTAQDVLNFIKLGVDIKDLIAGQ